MTAIFKCVAYSCLLGLALSCRDSRSTILSDPPPASFDEFAISVKSRSDNKRVTGKGVFDLKSICLNLQPPTRDSEEYCSAYFSEHSGVNPPTVRVSLRFCNGNPKSNCIERLRANSPPESIVIRDALGKSLKSWAKALASVEQVQPGHPVVVRIDAVD